MTTKTQRKANRKKWVAALRSGEYAQCRGFLESDGSFCCLGVLSKLAGTTRIEHNVSVGAPFITYDGVGGTAPEKA